VKYEFCLLLKGNLENVIWDGEGWGGGSMNELKEGKINVKIGTEGGVYRMSVITRELSYVSPDLSGVL